MEQFKIWCSSSPQQCRWRSVFQKLHHYQRSCHWKCCQIVSQAKMVRFSVLCAIHIASALMRQFLFNVGNALSSAPATEMGESRYGLYTPVSCDRHRPRENCGAPLRAYVCAVCHVKSPATNMFEKTGIFCCCCVCGVCVWLSAPALIYLVQR